MLKTSKLLSWLAANHKLSTKPAIEGKCNRETRQGVNVRFEDDLLGNTCLHFTVCEACSI